MTSMTDEEIAAQQASIRFTDRSTFIPASGMTDADDEKVTPLDLLDITKYTDKETRNDRLSICKGCDRLFKPTRSCKECGCFMSAKTWLVGASCPIGKW